VTSILSKLNPFNWGKQQLDPTLQQAGLTLGVHESAKTSTDIEFDRELGVNRELIHDPRLEALLEDDIYIRKLLTDDKGKLKTDNDGNPQYIIVGKNKHAETVRLMFSQLNRTSFITPKDAELQRIQSRLSLLKLRASQPEPTYTMADSAWYTELERMADNMISDCINGRKAQLLKRWSKATSVEVSQRTNNKGAPPLV